MIFRQLALEQSKTVDHGISAVSKSLGAEVIGDSRCHKFIQSRLNFLNVCSGVRRLRISQRDLEPISLEMAGLQFVVVRGNAQDLDIVGVQFFRIDGKSLGD